MPTAKKEILIVNLLRNGDIYATAHLIHSIKSIDPGQSISILVWDEFKTSAETLRDVANVYTINRKKILTYKKNAIYSDAFALDTFFNNLSIVKKTNWFKIINYSNDLLSAHITSYLSSNSTQTAGITVNENMSATPSSSWDIIFNDIITEFDYTPVHFVDCYHNMLGLSRVTQGEKIKINNKYNEIAFRNLNDIREQEKKSKGIVSIVGIQLFTSKESKNIPYIEIVKLIDHLASSEKYFPILLIAPTENERKLANAINNEFNNELVSVESDFHAIGSLLMNIDLLVTPDTAIKHIADLVDTPIVEVSLGESPFLKQGTIGEYNLIITNNIKDRTYDSSETNHVKSSDIFACIEVMIENRNLAEFTISEGVTIYQPARDTYGIRYRYLAGDCPVHEEVSRIMARTLISQIYKKPKVPNAFLDLNYFNQIDIKKWIETQNIAIGKTVKDVLGTLRALHMAKENRNKTSEFIQALDRLLGHCNDQTLVSIPCLIFRAKLEALQGQSFYENSKSIEALLFIIKDEIQMAYKCIKELDNTLKTNISSSVSANI